MSDLATAQRILLQRLESLQRSGVAQIGKVFAPLAPLPAVAAPSANVNETRPAPLVRPNSADISLSPQKQPPAVDSPPAKTYADTSAPSRSPIQESSMARAKPAAGPASDSKFHLPLPRLLATKERTIALDALRNEVAACKLCKELACTRTQTVFGVGVIKPKVLFFGEAPGAEEDRTGEPFVGRSGQLLRKIIEACTFTDEDIYILNTLKCRPPDNRPPEPQEIANCRPFWEQQIELLQPQYIVCAGTHSSQALLETAESIGKLRGKFHLYRGIKVVCTYHPSYLLRNPPAKKFVWEDMQMLMKEMGIKPPPKATGG